MGLGARCPAAGTAPHPLASGANRRTGPERLEALRTQVADPNCRTSTSVSRCSCPSAPRRPPRRGSWFGTAPGIVRILCNVTRRPSGS